MRFRKRHGYEDEDIRLALPDGWAEAPSSSSDLLVFADPSHQLQLTVSVILTRDLEPGTKKLLDAARLIYEHRVKAERAHLSTDDPLVLEDIEVVGGTPLGIFSGQERATGRMFMGFIRARGRRIVTGYLEGLSGIPREHFELGARIFDAIEIK